MSGPQVWGPFGWKFIHYITYGYPNNPSELDKQKYLDFFNILQFVLPCSICSNHLQQHMKINPLTDDILSDKMKFIEWGILMHNIVNLSNGGKEYTIMESIEMIQKNNKEDMKNHIHYMIEDNDNRLAYDPYRNKNNYIYIYYLLLLLLIIIIILYLKYIKNKS